MASLLHRWRYLQFNSRCLRGLLSFYFREDEVYKIQFGPLRGHRLHYDRSINFHAILGLWDLETFNFLSRLFSREFLRHPPVIADVGANIGLFSLWCAHVLGPERGTVYAFEPNPNTVAILRKNITLNKKSNIVMEELACSDHTGKTEFFLGHHHHVSSLVRSWASSNAGSSEKVIVKTTTLDDYFFGKTQRPSPSFIKMDIEGGGVFALRGCDQCLSQVRPLLWIESHTPEEDRAISDILLRHNYLAYRLNNRRAVVNLHSTHPDPNGVWGTLLVYPSERADQLAPLLGLPLISGKKRAVGE